VESDSPLVHWDIWSSSVSDHGILVCSISLTGSCKFQNDVYVLAVILWDADKLWFFASHGMLRGDICSVVFGFVCSLTFG
jgi:hypothetical protein